MREVLVRAIARHAPPWLAAQREDLVQTAMLRLLELERQPGGDAVKSSTYLWKVAYSVVGDEMRRRRRERESPLEEAGDPPSPDTAAQASQWIRPAQTRLMNSLKHCLEGAWYGVLLFGLIMFGLIMGGTACVLMVRYFRWLISVCL